MVVYYMEKGLRLDSQNTCIYEGSEVFYNSGFADEHKNVRRRMTGGYWDLVFHLLDLYDNSVYENEAYKKRHP
ncbi:MAG: hypothetical protein RLZZ262_783 [Bacteroidota bacterium]